MKPMMLAMKHVPGGLAMMEKMMPLMFPADGARRSCGKVMPDMIREVEDVMGEMPADMAELMPDLLPKTMDSLMPDVPAAADPAPGAAVHRLRARVRARRAAARSVARIRRAAPSSGAGAALSRSCAATNCRDCV